MCESCFLVKLGLKFCIVNNSWLVCVLMLMIMCGVGWFFCVCNVLFNKFISICLRGIVFLIICSCLLKGVMFILVSILVILDFRIDSDVLRVLVICIGLVLFVDLCVNSLYWVIMVVIFWISLMILLVVLLKVLVLFLLIIRCSVLL